MRKYTNYVLRRPKGQLIISLYILFLLSMPNELFNITAIWTIASPDEIIYKWGTFDVSWLFLPLIVIGLFYYFSRRGKMQTALLLFIVTLVVKDVINFALGKTYMLERGTYEMYFLYVVAGCFLFIVFGIAQNEKDIFTFWEIFIWMTILMLFLAVLMGITPGQYDYVNRYSATNLAHGETGMILGISVVYLLVKKDVPYRMVLFVLCIVGIIATGTRKDLLYIAVSVFMYPLICGLKGQKWHSRFPYVKRSTVGLFLGGIVVLLFVGPYLVEHLNFDRVLDLFASILSKGEENSLRNDYSFIGRVESLLAGWEVVKGSPVLGINFSFYNLQYQMQCNGYPTFPHMTILFNWCIMGLLVLVPIVVVVKSTLKLLRKNNRFWIIGFYYCMYHTVSGGMWSSFKAVFFNFFIIWFLVLQARKKSCIDVGQKN